MMLTQDTLHQENRATEQVLMTCLFIIKKALRRISGKNQMKRKQENDSRKDMRNKSNDDDDVGL